MAQQKGAKGQVTWASDCKMSQQIPISTDRENQKVSCPINTGKEHQFGVKSYLHQFYDCHQSMKSKSGNTDDDESEDISGDEEDYHYLIGPGKKRHKCMCCPEVSPMGLCWRVGLWTGVNLLVLGSILILVGFLMPRRSIVVDHKINLEIVDRDAQRYNFYLDLCRIVGLGMFCCGVAILTIALLLPSFIRRFSEADFSHKQHSYQEPFKWKLKSEEEQQSKQPNFPNSGEEVIPVTEELTGVQPKIEQATSVALTQSGVMNVR